MPFFSGFLTPQLGDGPTLVEGLLAGVFWVSEYLPHKVFGSLGNFMMGNFPNGEVLYSIIHRASRVLNISFMLYFVIKIIPFLSSRLTSYDLEDSNSFNFLEDVFLLSLIGGWKL